MKAHSSDSKQKSFNKDDFFIGYTYKGQINRRGFWQAALGFSFFSGLCGLGLSAFQMTPGKGSWNMSEIIQLSGYLETHPYPILWTKLSGSLKPVLLYCLEKCGAQKLLQSYQPGMVRLKGSLLHHDQNYAFSISDNKQNWIERSEETPDFLLPKHAKKILDITLEGEILDSKCWFGAMRPGFGKIHKSCAKLCIAGGIAPVFFIKTSPQKNRLLILTDLSGNAISYELMPYIADPVRITGMIYKKNSYFEFRINLDQIIRL